MKATRRLENALFLVVTASALAAGCGGGGSTAPPSKFTYTLRLFDFPEIERGQPLRMKLMPKDGATVLARYDGSIDPNGERTVTFENVLEAGKEYRVDYYVDLDRNGEYTRPSGAMFRDPSWRRLVTGEAAPFMDSHAHDSNFFDVFPF